jgi:mono/diheme cytochrome c family protein
MHRLTYKLLTLSTSLLLIGCGNATSPEDENTTQQTTHEENTAIEDNTTVTEIPMTFYTPDTGRLLGSQCAQCHGTNGISVNEWDSIAGENDLEDEIYEDDEAIMLAQAHGYTTEEITLIGNWLKTLPKEKDD